MARGRRLRLFVRWRRRGSNGVGVAPNLEVVIGGYFMPVAASAANFLRASPRNLTRSNSASMEGTTATLGTKPPHSAIIAGIKDTQRT